jgi:enoyl-CoA hydratase
VTGANARAGDRAAGPPFVYETDGHVAVMTMNRPEKYNAVTHEMRALAAEAWEDFQSNPALRVAILTGAGPKAFCTGADLEEFVPTLTATPAPGKSRWPRSERRFGDAVYKPIIAAVNGHCIGWGLELLLATDIRVASENAKFGLPEVQLGLIPIEGTHVRLPRQVPYCRAMELLLLGDLVSAHEAQSMGLVNRVVPAADVMPTARTMAERIARNSPLAARTIKEIVGRSLSMALDQAFYMESSFGDLVYGSPDALEGHRAFSEKRQPVFGSS